MTSQPSDTAATPKLVVDGWGNLWQHFNDAGYLRLLVTQDPGRTLADIVSETGSVKAVVIAEPTELLREKVARDGAYPRPKATPDYAR